MKTMMEKPEKIFEEILLPGEKIESCVSLVMGRCAVIRHFCITNTRVIRCEEGTLWGKSFDTLPYDKINAIVFKKQFNVNLLIGGLFLIMGLFLQVYGYNNIIGHSSYVMMLMGAVLIPFGFFVNPGYYQLKCPTLDKKSEAKWGLYPCVGPRAVQVKNFIGILEMKLGVKTIK